MAHPTFQFLVAWRGEGMNFITNSGFEIDLTGWITNGTGIGGAVTSMARITTDKYIRSASARVVTTGVDSSGVAFDISDGGAITFGAGWTYRYQIYVKSESGGTSAKLRMGSLGTVGDRATATMTITGTWTRYTVDWTPAADRTDAQIMIGNNAAATMTFLIDDAMAYEAINDVTPYVVDQAKMTRGANFDGTAEAPGTLEFTLGPGVLSSLDDWRFAPMNTSSDLWDTVNDLPLVHVGLRVWVRATYLTVTYGWFYGTVRRITPLPATFKAEVVCEDMLADLAITKYRQTGDFTKSYTAFREDVITDAGFPAYTYAAAGVVEDELFYSFADGNSLDILAEVNKATGSIHYVEPNADSDLLYRYTIKDRDELINDGAFAGIFAEHLDDDIAGIEGYELTNELLVNEQRVRPHVWTETASATLTMDYPTLPFTVNSGVTRKIYLTYSDGYLDGTPVLTENGTNAPTITETWHPDAAAITIVGGVGNSVFTVFSIAAAVGVDHPGGWESDEDLGSQATYGKRVGSDIDSPYVPTLAKAESLAQYYVYRYTLPKARPTVVIQNRHPSHLSLQVGDRLQLTFARLVLVEQPLVIRAIETTVTKKGLVWVTKYHCEEIP